MDDVQEWLDSLFDELLFDLSLQETSSWIDGLRLFPEAEIIPENSAEKTKGASNASP